MNEFQRRKAVIEARETDLVRWSDPRQLETAWEARAIVAAQFIPAGMRVADIGCGSMTLEAYLPIGCSYLPCDVVRRDNRTVLADLNGGGLPREYLRDVDIVSMLGVWEYLYDPDETLAALAHWGRPVVTSYCPSDLATELDRRALGWVNDFTRDGFVAMAARHGYRVALEQRIDNAQCVFKLVCSPPAGIARTKRVHVLSSFNGSNFGDRLGIHQLLGVLPAHAEVTLGTLVPFSPPGDGTDLLVIGIGNSLFGTLFSEHLLQAVDRSTKAIGIFGTQYRERLPLPNLAGLLDRLAHWYARYEDDLHLCGKGRNNVSHFGDWLVNEFPLARGTLEPRMTVPPDVMSKEYPLDRLIQLIQQRRHVFSTRLHPLLCALTSAEQVGYREQREFGTDAIVSGKFRSMLFDVFGRTYPENAMWSVDRERVAVYKSIVRRNTDKLRHDIAALLA